MYGKFLIVGCELFKYNHFSGGRQVKQPEAIIQSHILKWLRMRNIFAFTVKSTATYDPKLKRYRKVATQYRLGVADICGILPSGRFFCCEVKSLKGRLRPEQKTFLEDVTRNGGLAFVARSVLDVEIALGEAGVCL